MSAAHVHMDRQVIYLVMGNLPVATLQRGVTLPPSGAISANTSSNRGVTLKPSLPFLLEFLSSSVASICGCCKLIHKATTLCPDVSIL